MAGNSPKDSGWDSEVTVDWSRVPEVSMTGGVPWNVPVANNKVDFKAKPAGLQKKSNFHEKMHPLTVNLKTRRAVAGYTVSFSVPKPMTRISLLDLSTGKSVHSEQVEAMMRPLALLDDGNTIVMRGTDDRGGRESPGQLQLWRLKGKKIDRTATWTPYPKIGKKFGRVTDGVIGTMLPVEGAQVLTLSSTARLALWDVFRRKPIWYADLNRNNHGMALSCDRKLVAVFNDKTVLVAEAKTGNVLGSLAINASRVGWNRIAWSPSGKKLLLSSVGDLRVVNVETGEVDLELNLSDGPVATRGLSFPHDDYAMLDKSVLVHLPSKIRVCSYSDASSIAQRGETAFIAVQGSSGGIVVGSSFPHPPAVEQLKKAQDDPTLFLLHPGVDVSIDVSQVPNQYRQEVQKGLEASAQKSGYTVDPSAPIKLIAKITGPKTEAVSYIARGSYVVNQYNSSVVVHWNDKNVWSRNATNIPGMLMTKGNETIEQALKRHGEKPNTSMFSSVSFPKFMQKPTEGKGGGNRHNCLMSSKFTVNGLVDNN